MKIDRHTLFYMAQIGVIIGAVLITFIRLGVHWVDGYESHVESWFEEQGIHLNVERLSLKIEGFRPELSIHGLTIKGESNINLIELSRAKLYFNVLQSLLQQQIIIDKADFYISQAKLDISDFNSSTHDGDFGLSSGLLHRLSALKYVSLKIDQIELVDKQQTYTLYQTIFSSEGDGLNKLLRLRTSLRQQKLSMLNAQLNIDMSQLLVGSSIMGKGYASLNVPNLSSISFAKDIALNGDLKVNSWLEFEGMNFNVVSSVHAQKVMVSVAKKSHTIDAQSIISTVFKDGELSVEVTNELLNIDKVDFKTLGLNAQSTLVAGKFKNNLLLIESLAVDDLKKLASSIPKLKKLNKLAKSLKPKGYISELFIQMPNFQQLEQFQVAISANDLQWKSKGAIPAVKKLTLDLVANQQHFNAQVSSDSLNILLAELFTQPFSVNSLKATVNGQINSDGVIVDIPKIAIKQNKARIDGRASLNFQNNASPYLFLRLQMKNADIKIITPFMPQILMDTDVINWVKQSVKTANVKMTDVLYAGRLENDVNFDIKNNGIFDATLALENIDLSYDPKWPSFQSKQATLTFKNYQLKVTSALGSSQGINAKEVVFYIPDLDDPHAELSLKVNDTLEKQWGFLKASPIKEDIPFFAEVSELQGKVKTAVTAGFPLINPKSSDVLFNVDLKAQHAGFAVDSLGVSLSEINAAINITQDGISIKPAPAKSFGHAVILEASTDEDKSIRLKMFGESIEIASLLQTLPSEVTKHLSGKSAWEVNVLINQSNKDKLKPLVSINAHSGLKGTAIHLPEPFSLAAEDVNHIKVSVDIYENEYLNVRLTLDHRFDVMVALTNDHSGAYDLIGGHIKFGDKGVLKQIEKGFSVNGHIAELNLDHWNAYLAPTTMSSSTRSLALINSIEVSIAQLEVKGVTANNANISLKKVETGLAGTVQSSVAKGEFFIPVQQAASVPIDINMDVVDINIKEGLGNGNKTVYATNQLPTLKFRSKQFTINGKQFTDAKIDIESHITDFFELKNLSLKHNKVVLNAQGSWDYNKEIDEHESRVKITLKGEQFGQTLSALGLGESIENGKIDISSELEWAKPFWSLDLADVTGSAKLKLEEGYLIDVEPGGGRFVGLLSLSALPRRLTLDFSDFFKKGLEFDRINGDFLIYEGNMWTENLKMTGSVTDVKIVGRTGLKARDYDQLITVIPQIRDALPVLGTLVSGSSVGWALLLIQKLFKGPIDESVSIKYKVTGHWDDPKIEVIDKPKLKNIEDERYEDN